MLYIMILLNTRCQVEQPFRHYFCSLTEVLLHTVSTLIPSRWNNGGNFSNAQSQDVTRDIPLSQSESPHNISPKKSHSWTATKEKNCIHTNYNIGMDNAKGITGLNQRYYTIWAYKTQEIKYLGSDEMQIMLLMNDSTCTLFSVWLISRQW